MSNLGAATLSAPVAATIRTDGPAAPAIRARGVVRQFEHGAVRALDGLDLDVERGEFVAVCGPSGCGKTTLLNLIAAIDRPDEGELSVCGCALAGLPERRTDAFRASVVGLVFQLHNLVPHLSASENVQVPMLAGGVSRGERAARAEMLLRRVGLSHRLDARPTTLSGGERQRVAICRALVNRPALLLADEPTGALDSRSGDQLIDLLTELQAETGMTLVVVTHDARVAQRARRIVQMLDGRVVADGKTAESSE